MNEDKPSPRADLFIGIAFLAVSIGILVGALRMDRLERLQATIYTAPGLVPGILGAALGLMSVLLIVRSVRAGAAVGVLPSARIGQHWRLAAALVLCLGFALGLVGRGPPFWLGAAIFVSAFVFVFQFDDRRQAGTLGRGVVFAAGYGLVVGLAIHHLFQDVFLVRLP
jgi:Tripartite tricarboxylate transporter TctB family